MAHAILERSQSSPDSDYQTGVLEAAADTEIGISDEALTSIRELPPPAAPDMYNRHDLVAEGQETPARSVPLNAYDSIVASHALMNPTAAEWVTTMYGEESYRSALDKARAITDVNIANAHTSAVQAYKAYDRLAKGAIPDDSYLELYDRFSGTSAFTEAPIHEIGEESLGFDLEESRVVFEALRMTALHPQKGREGDEDVAARDLLSRYAPSHSERAFYGALLEHAGVDLGVGKLPEYPIRK